MEKVDLSKYDNSWYSSHLVGKFKRILWYFTNVFFFKNGLNVSAGLKAKILRAFGAKVGKGVMIKPCVNIKNPWLLEIDDYAWIGENVWIDNLVKVTIGKSACLSQGVLLLCGNHNYKSSTFDLIVGEIHIEDGAWVCAKSLVCPGVTLHSHAVLGVNSVANRDLDAYTIYQGNPATKVRTREIQK